MKALAIGILTLVMATGAGAQVGGGNARQDRRALEQQLRERVAQVTQKRLEIDDTKMAQLQTVNSRYAPQLGNLGMQERRARQQLREQLSSPTPDQAAVGRLLDNLLQLQRQRVSLLESEQKDLSGFLTPVQRAKYMALQAQIRKRADQLRMKGGAGGRGRAGNRPPR